jgi:hypothetical protein
LVDTRPQTTIRFRFVAGDCLPCLHLGVFLVKSASEFGVIVVQPFWLSMRAAARLIEAIHLQESVSL